MSKKILLSLLCILFTTPLFGEGFTADTLVATWQTGLKSMQNMCQGFEVFALSTEGKIVPGKITLKETTEEFVYYELTVNDTKIHADAQQYFFSPSRNAWTKLIDLEAGKDTVFSAIKGPIPVQFCKKINWAPLNIKVPIHRISVEKHENYFITEDLILVHNFIPTILTIGQVILNNAIDIAITMVVSIASSYLSEKVAPAVQNFLRTKLNLTQIAYSTSETGPLVTGIAPQVVPPPVTNQASPMTMPAQEYPSRRS